jgi:hypothetical protein
MNMDSVATRLRELSKLRDGWLDGFGKAPTRDSIRLAYDTCGCLVGWPQPGLFPTPRGGVQAEWYDDQNWIVEFVFEPDGKTIQAAAQRTGNSDDVEEAVFRPRDPDEHWGPLGDWVGKYLAPKPLTAAQQASQAKVVARIEERKERGEMKFRPYEDFVKEQCAKRGMPYRPPEVRADEYQNRRVRERERALDFDVTPEER